jgi:hypothetical protein
MKVSRDDFMHALDEVHPAFGVSEQELQQCVLNGIIKFDHHVEVGLLVVFSGICLTNPIGNREFYRMERCSLTKSRTVKERLWCQSFSTVLLALARQL